MVLQPPSSPEEIPVFFIHAGVIGWPLPYAKLAHSLGRYSITIQRTADVPTSSFEEMAAYYVQAIRALQPQGPYHFVGVCYGAFLVYELAKQLSDAGECVQLAVMIDSSPVDEKRPHVFNELGQPLPNTAAHPIHFFQSVLQMAFPEDILTMNTEGANLDDIISQIFSTYPWIPFTAEEMQGAYLGFFNLLRCGWFGYSPVPGANIHNCVLIRNREPHPFFHSHTYGLHKLINPQNLSVLVPTMKLSLLSETETARFIGSVIKLYLK